MLKTLLANKVVIGIVVAVVLVGGVYWYVHGSAAPSFSSYTVTQGNVVESVNEPATVQAENNVALSFQEAGQIAAVNVTEGEQVSAGTVLASLNQSALQAGVEQANAALAAAQAQLDSLASGTRPEQLAIDQTAVSNAVATLSASIQSAYTAASDAVTNQTDNMFTTPQNGNPVLLIQNPNSQLTINIQGQRVAIGTALGNFYAALNSTSSDPTSLFGVANTTLSQIQTYLDELALAATNAGSTVTAPGATLAQYKVYIGTARTEVGAAATALAAADSGYTNAQGTLTLAEAGATPQSIEAQNAAVLQAQAAQAAAQVALANATMVAPFPGTVQNLTAQLGQVVSPAVPVLTLVDNGGLKIIAYVSDTDVGKIATGDNAEVTLDAFTGTTFPATVTTIGTTETSVNGSPAYQVTLHFTQPESTVKDGMTGNVEIVAAEHDNVIEIPSRLLISNGSSTFVLVPQGKTTVEKQVTTGITGSDGSIEITSGLNAGDVIANF